MKEIAISASPFLVLLVIISALLVALTLYYREKRSELSARMRTILAILRALSWFLLAFLLLGPVIRSWTRTSEQALILFLVDDSRSVHAVDSLDPSISDRLDEIAGGIKAGTGIEYLYFGDEVYNEASNDGAFGTNIGAALDHVSNMYRNRNLGAVILVSDGINNGGSDPISLARKLDAPIYSLALGDTTEHRDIRISRIENNRIAFLGSKFPMRMHVSANKAKGRQTRLEILHKGRIVFRENLSLDNDDYYLARSLELDADAPGLQRYTIRLSAVDGERNLSNNTKSVYVEVMDASRKVLILSEGPHPDISALHQAIESTEQVDAEVEYYDGNMPDLSGYNLLILYQLPSSTKRIDPVVQKARDTGLPVWFFLGNRSDVISFDRLGLPLKIIGPRGKFNQVGGIYDERFSLFLSDPLLSEALPELPPLVNPFGEYRAALDMQQMLTQRIGRVNSEKALLSFHDLEGWKTGYLAGEGIWRWRVDLYRKYGNHEVFDALISSATRYLSIREERTRFRIRYENSYLQSEPVALTAELYNEAFEAVTDKRIDLRLTDTSGTSYDYVFTPDEQGYQLNIGFLSPGTYRFSSRSESYDPVSGQFVVKEVDIENDRTQADYDLLTSISGVSGGDLLAEDEWQGLVGMLDQRDDIKPITYSRDKFVDLSTWPWYLLVILLLLSAEWAARRVSGTY